MERKCRLRHTDGDCPCLVCQIPGDETERLQLGERILRLIPMVNKLSGAYVQRLKDATARLDELNRKAQLDGTAPSDQGLHGD